MPASTSKSPLATRTVAIIQARSNSQRLPGKVLMEIAGMPLLAHVVSRAKAIKRVDEVVVATTDTAADTAVEDLCREIGVACFRGSEEDVLDRYYQAATRWKAGHVMRLTADDPFTCPRQAERVLRHHIAAGADFTHNHTCWGSGMPLGTTAEVFTMAALTTSWVEGTGPHREYVDEYVPEHPERFRIESVPAPPELQRPELRLTVDTAEDLELAREIYQRLYTQGEIISLEDVVRLLDNEPDLAAINRHVQQKTI